MFIQVILKGHDITAQNRQIDIAPVVITASGPGAKQNHLVYTIFFCIYEDFPLQFQLKVHMPSLSSAPSASIQYICFYFMLLPG